MFRSAAALFLTCVVVIGLVSVTRAEEQKPAADKITYEQHILPIFREKCGTCHNGNDKNGDLALDNYQAAIQGGASGEVIKTDGDADNSKLYQVVAHLSQPFMPPEQPKLPDEQLALIKKWIEQGALKDAGSVAKVKKTNVARVEVSMDRPAGPPPMPENLPQEPVLVSARANGVTALAANPWSPLVAVSGHTQILLYDVSTLELTAVLPFPEGQPYVLRFSRNGQILLAGGGRGAHSGKVILFDVKTGQRIAEVGDEYDVVLAADLSPDQTMIALGGPKKMIRCYSVATGELMYEMKKHTDWVTAMEFSPDGVLLATADRSNGLVVWEAGTGREFYSLNGHTAAITDVSWAPDSNVLASGSEDSTVKLWEMQNGNQIKNWGAHGGGVLSLDFSRDARIATSGRDARGKSWDSNGNAVKTYEPGLPDLGTAVALSAETDRILVGDLTGVVHVYSAKDGTKLGELSTNPAPIAARIQVAQRDLEKANSEAGQAAAALAQVQKGIADRKLAADTAAQAAVKAKEAAEAAEKTRVQAAADQTAKQQGVTTVDQQVKAAEAALTKAAGETQAASKVLMDRQAASRKAQADAEAAQTALLAAQKAAAEKPDDANLAQASKMAAQVATGALDLVAKAAAEQAEATRNLARLNDAQIAVTSALNTVKKQYADALAAKTKADEAVTAATAAVKTATEQAAVAKTNADAAAKQAEVTPEIQKQLTEAEARVQATTQVVNTVKGRLARLEAAQARTQPKQTAAATN